MKKLISLFLILSLMVPSCVWARSPHSLSEDDFGYSRTPQATLSLINNQGAPLKTFKDLGSKQQLRSFAVNLAVAAVVGTGSVPEGADILDHLMASTMNTAVSTALSIPIQNQDPKEALKQAVRSVVANTINGYVAGKIGQHRGDMDFLTHKLAHGILGAVVGAGLTKDWAEGAISGGIGGLVAETIAESLPNNIDKDIRANIALLSTATTALLTGKDVNVAIFTAENALRYNFKKSSDPKQDAQDAQKETEDEEEKEEKQEKNAKKEKQEVKQKDGKKGSEEKREKKADVLTPSKEKPTATSAETTASHLPAKPVADKSKPVKANPSTAPPSQKEKHAPSKEPIKTTATKNDAKTKAPASTKTNEAKKAPVKPVKKVEKEKSQTAAKKTTKSPTQTQSQKGALSSNEPFNQIFNINRPTFAERIGVASYEETEAAQSARSQHKSHSIDLPLDPTYYDIPRAAQTKSLEEFTEDYIYLSSLKKPNGTPSAREREIWGFKAERTYNSARMMDLSRRFLFPGIDRVEEFASTPTEIVKKMHINQWKSEGRLTTQKLRDDAERIATNIDKHFKTKGVELTLASLIVLMPIRGGFLSTVSGPNRVYVSEGPLEMAESALPNEIPLLSQFAIPEAANINRGILKGLPRATNIEFESIPLTLPHSARIASGESRSLLDTYNMRGVKNALETQSGSATITRSTGTVTTEKTTSIQVSKAPNPPKKPIMKASSASKPAVNDNNVFGNAGKHKTAHGAKPEPIASTKPDLRLDPNNNNSIGNTGKESRKEAQTTALEDHSGNGFYNSHMIRQQLEEKYPGRVSSTTVPSPNAKNVKLAGQRHSEKNAKGMGSKIVFDLKGFPIFDDVAKFDTKIAKEVASIRNSYKHKVVATRNLWEEIQSGRISKSHFTQQQLGEIQQGSDKITGFTWHHHQDMGRMQLIPQSIHDITGHVGGMKMWAFESK